MTYCVGVLVAEGLVFAADTRTNAGVDNVSSFRKMTVLERPGERVLVLLSAGNLATTQAVITQLREAAAAPAPEQSTIANAPTMYRVAQLVGDALRAVCDRDRLYVGQAGGDVSASFILGGQIAGEQPRLFQVYSAGNFAEASLETPFVQIGESKYGKPILDRLLRQDLGLSDAAKCVLISYDPTLRSNISVGCPIDILCCRTDALRVDSHARFDDANPYFRAIREQWADGISALFLSLPGADLGQWTLPIQGDFR